MEREWKECQREKVSKAKRIERTISAAKICTELSSQVYATKKKNTKIIFAGFIAKQPTEALLYNEIAIAAAEISTCLLILWINMKVTPYRTILPSTTFIMQNNN